MSIQLCRIPAAVALTGLPAAVEVSREITPKDGLVILAQATLDPGGFTFIEDENGRREPLLPDEIFPVVLGRRRALRGRSGDVPGKLAVGDALYLLTGSGIAGTNLGFCDDYYEPAVLTVLGAVLVQGRSVHLKDYSVPRRQSLECSAPIVGVIGTCMEVGKTTMVCKLVEELANEGLRVAAVKLTGVASVCDLVKIRRAGAHPVMSFMDGGLTSTCGDVDEVKEVAMSLLHAINKGNPDIIVAEFGDGLLGEYGVQDLIRCHDIQRHVIAHIIGASDLVSAYGAQKLMQANGAEASLITGPAVNNPTAAAYVERHLGILAESNQDKIPKTFTMVQCKRTDCLSKQGKALRSEDVALPKDSNSD